MQLAVTAESASETSGALTQIGPETLVTGSVEVAAEASGVVFAGDVDGDGDPIHELSGTIVGTSNVVFTGFLIAAQPDPIDHNRYLYLLLSSGVGFDPTDNYTGVGTTVSENFPDGHVRDFDRNLYQSVNVGVGFDPTDTYTTGVGTIVSETFPDGHTRDDFARYLYQRVNPTKARGTLGDRLVVIPGIRDRRPPIPRANPPSSVP
jgi:hypothetical protein